MALIKCSECGKEFSDKANACPNCACPINANTNIKRKKVIIKKCFALALRTSVLIDNQPVGEIGIGANKTIELELPTGTHYVGLSTNVKHGNIFEPMAVSNAIDGKQFIIDDNDEIIEIEILAKGSWSNSTGRCIIGQIRKCDEKTINTEKEKNKNLKNSFFEKHKALVVTIVGLIVLYFLYNLLLF